MTTKLPFRGCDVALLSFGDPTPFTGRIKEEAGQQDLYQVRMLAQARQTVEAGANIIIAHEPDAGGHSDIRHDRVNDAHRVPAPTKHGIEKANEPDAGSRLGH